MIFVQIGFIKIKIF